MGRLWVAAVACCVCWVVALAPVRGQAADPAAEPASIDSTDTPLASFNRELVEKVKRAYIYIGMMGEYQGTTRFAGSGSGVIIIGLPDENAALAVTNDHVAGHAPLLQVETWDHQTFRAITLATDPGVDSSLIKIFDIPPTAYEVAALGNSDEVRAGEPALAIGAPGIGFDMANVNRSDPFHSATLQQTTTMDVVCGLEYDPYQQMMFHIGWRSDLGKQSMTNLPYRILTQTTINPGNSGGPLFNDKGELIGLNHAHSFMGGTKRNFTVPINATKRLVFDYLDKGTYEIPWFGMDVLIPPAELTTNTALTEFVEKHLDMKTINIFNVRKDSPAERGGLKQGDIITEFDGRTFPNVIDLRTYIFGMDIGKQVPVVVKRGGREVELTLEVGIKRNYDSEFSL